MGAAIELFRALEPKWKPYNAIVKTLMPYGLKEHTIQAIRSVFVLHPQVEQAILYGSRARGAYRNGSDIDLVLLGPDLDLATQFKIDTELDDLLLPYKIDLSLHHHIANPDLLDHIARIGKVFWKKGEAVGAAEK